MLSSTNGILCPIDLTSTSKFMKNAFSKNPEQFFDLNFLQRIETILSWIKPTPNDISEYQSFVFHLADSLCDLNKISPKLNNETMKKVLEIIINVRRNLIDEQLTIRLDEKLVECLKILLNSKSIDDDHLFRKFLVLVFIFDLKFDSVFAKNFLMERFLTILKESITMGDSKLSAKICFNLTKNLFDLNSFEDNEKFSNEIFNYFKEIRSEMEQNQNIDELSSPLSNGREESLAIAVHCLISAFIRTVSFDQKLLHFPVLKLIIQDGLTSKQNYVRKISRETLNMVVNLFNFSNDPVWSSYLNFLDILEQKQVHLIKPALNSLDIFIKGIEEEQNSTGLQFIFDFSWPLIAFRNGFHHLNGFVAKTMVVKYFQTPIPKNSFQICNFLIKFVLPTLNDGDLYQRCIDDNNLEQFLDSVKFYFQQLMEVDDNIRTLFEFVYRCLESRSWAPAPLFFLMNALSTLPNLKPIWSEEIFEQLRSAFYSALQGSSPSFRSAIQESAIILALKLIDWNCCSPIKFSSNVLPFIPDELISAQTKFFNQATILWTASADEITFEEISLLQNASARRAATLTGCVRLGFEKFLNIACHSINECLMDVDCRPYINFNRMDACLEILVHAQKLNSELFIADRFMSSLDVDNVLKYLIIRLNQPYKTGDCIVWNYFENLIHFFIRSKNYATTLLAFEKLLYEKIQTLENSLQYCFVLKFLYPFVEETKTIGESKSFWARFTRWTDDPSAMSDLENLDKLERQTFSAEFQKIRWKMIARFLSVYEHSSSVTDFSICVEELIETIFDLFDRVDDEMSLCLTDCLVSIVSKIRLDYIVLVRIIEIVQRVAFEQNKSQTYTVILSNLVSVLLIGFRQMDVDNRVLLKQLFQTIFDKLFTEAYQNNVVCLCAAKTFHWFVSKFTDGCDIVMKNFGDILLAFCTFGHVLRRDQKFNFVASDYLSKQGTDYQCNQLFEKYRKQNKHSQIEPELQRLFSSSEHLAAQKIRAFGLLLMEKYFASHSTSNADPLMTNVVQLIKEKFLELAEGKSRSKFHHLSLCHRARTRTLQLLLILQPYIRDKNLANDLIAFSRDLLTAEGHHGSVRIFIEWFAIRLCLAFPPLMDDWLSFCDHMGFLRIGSLCSWVQVVMHLLLAIAGQKDSQSFYHKACYSILPLCTAQNFTVRCCAQAVLKRTWTVYRQNFNDNAPFQSLLDHCVSFSLEHRNATKHVEKQLADFYFSIFDICTHYTLENIFSVIPIKCYLPEDETIGLDVFKTCCGSNVESLTFVLFANKIDDGLKSALSIIWNAGCKPLEEDEKFVPTRFDVLQTKSQMEADDIMTYLPEIFNSDHSFNFASADVDRQLIVVASLLDRPTNLGGLCRTCEIFGATEYVISSLKFTEDIQFQNLSVSSERWVRIAEVKPTDLEVYFGLKQKQGFSIVGVEQTTTSVDLRKFKFPKKTVLLLGNEKRGIPPYLIQNFLDFCVVIPQTGLIRSLNVHVAGAMLIWEYAKQHRLK